MKLSIRYLFFRKKKIERTKSKRALKPIPITIKLNLNGQINLNLVHKNSTQTVFKFIKNKVTMKMIIEFYPVIQHQTVKKRTIKLS